MQPGRLRNFWDLIFDMVLVDTPLPDCFVFRPTIHEDTRGLFVKTLNRSIFDSVGHNFECKEEFFSISSRNVIRGMHFQVPPYEHNKLIYCIRGAVSDVLLDLRPGSSYGNVATISLSDIDRNVLFVAKGVAHGFLAHTDETIMVYKTDIEYKADYDCGIHWNSFGHNWSVEEPIISLRDQSHQFFIDFRSPF